ncbi:MAG: nucleotidyltransferase family protein [Clostridiales bacterium]
MNESIKKPLYFYTKNSKDFNFQKLNEENLDLARQICVRNMLIQRKLELIIAKFNEKKINYIILKGFHLINTIYPSGVRSMEDIDILINPKDYLKVDEILNTLNYEKCVFILSLKIHQNFSKKITYQDNLSPAIPVDIHLSLGPYPYLGKLNYSFLFEKIESIKVNALEINVLLPELLLIHLCLHSFSHIHENSNSHSCDIISVVRYYNYKFDWSFFIKTVKNFGLIMPVKHSIYRAISYENFEIPVNLKKIFENYQPSFFEKFIFNYSLNNINDTDKYPIQYISTPGILKKIKLIPQIIYPGKVFLKSYFNKSYIKYIKNILTLFKNL